MPAPEFEERSGFLVVTFKLPEQKAESEKKPLKSRVLALLAAGPMGKAELAESLGLPSVTGQLNRCVKELAKEGYLLPTIPNKPNSRHQKYKVAPKRRAQSAKG